ncbi:MAG: P-type DNA transfer protein VirB5 [Pseudomonadota bacterium]
MKHYFFSVMMLLMTASPVHAQIPVTDILLNTQTSMNQAENIAKFIEQITQLKAQLEQAKATYESLNGVRGMGALFNSPDSRKYLPSEWKTAYGDLESGKLSGITGSIDSIRKTYGLIDSKDLKTNDSGRQLFDKELTDAAVAKGFTEEGYKQASKRIDDIQGLLNKVDASSDQKDILDLQARIQAEQAMLQNEQIKLSLVQQLAQAEKALRAVQARDMRIQSAGGAPLKFTK